jgi:hypothetical protein
VFTVPARGPRPDWAQFATVSPVAPNWAGSSARAEPHVRPWPLASPRCEHTHGFRRPVDTTGHSQGGPRNCLGENCWRCSGMGMATEMRIFWGACPMRGGRAASLPALRSEGQLRTDCGDGRHSSHSPCQNVQAHPSGRWSRERSLDASRTNPFPRPDLPMIAGNQRSRSVDCPYSCNLRASPSDLVLPLPIGVPQTPRRWLSEDIGAVSCAWNGGIAGSCPTLRIYSPALPPPLVRDA